MIEFFRLGHLADEKPAACPTPAEIARCGDGVHGPGPACVLLDEPAGGVNLTMLQEACATASKAMNAEEERRFVVIEHNMEFVMALCTRILGA